MSSANAMVRGKFRLTLKVFFIICIIAGCFHVYVLRRRLYRLERRRNLSNADIVADIQGDLMRMGISVEGIAAPSLVRTHGRTLHETRQNASAEDTRVQLNTTVQGNRTINDSVIRRLWSGSNETLIINPHPYTYIINNPDKCKNKDVLLLIIITSAARNHAQRYAVRHTWANERNIPGIGIIRLFAVGKAEDTITQRGLEHENSIFKDIIQEDFVDSYRNLTIKTVMCLKWAAEFCPSAKFVMKADDDAFVNIYSLVIHLGRLYSVNIKELVTGHVYTDAKPIRDVHGVDKKWYLSKDDYPRETFPKYAAGFAYIISNDITRALFQVSLTVKYLFLEDVYLGLCLEKLGIEPVHQYGFRPWKMKTTSCKSDREIASHWFKTSQDMVKAWHLLVSSC